MPKGEILLESGTNELEIIEFFITCTPPGGGAPEPCYFGVNVAKVLEVIESPKLKHSKSAEHECFMGVISLRGASLPVLDLANWLKLDKQPGTHDVILVTEFNKLTTGFLVSGVTQIHRVSWSEVESPSGYLAEMPDNCMTGLVRLEERFVQLLDLERILAEFNPNFNVGEVQPEAGQAYTALIADDSTAIRMMLANNMRQAGFTVHTAVNGEDALNVLQGLREKAFDEGRTPAEYVDVLISDIEMPRMDGYTLTKRVKGDADFGALPVILFSSLITESLLHKGESVGADEQISKPEFDELAYRAMGLIRAARARG